MGSAPRQDVKIVKARRLTPSALLPRPAHPGDAGLDLFADEQVALPPGAWRLVRTGIALELPAASEAQVRPRSGLALEHGVTVLNAPGTIDEGYRGEVGVILINHGQREFTVTPGTRIAQMVVKPTAAVEIREAQRLKASRRGAGGFGSTGMGGTSGKTQGKTKR